MRFNFLFFLGLAACLEAASQPYIAGGKTRHRFAQLNAGIDCRFFPSYGTQSWTADPVQKTELNPYAESRLLIGGTHFWGHADFFIAIPLIRNSGSGFSTGAETGARFYPWQIRNKRIRPYAGVSMLPVHYSQGEGATITRFKIPVTAGITYNAGRQLIDFGIGRSTDISDNYYYSTTQSNELRTYPWMVSIGYKWQFETTVSAEKDWQSGRTERLTDTLASLKKLNGFTLAIGPSIAFFMKPSPSLYEKPFLDQHKTSNVFADIAVGYYLHRPDLQINFSYRSYKSELEAYGYEHAAGRKSIALEIYRFWMDFHGFAAFAGITVGHEWLEVKSTSPDKKETVDQNQSIRPGIIAGWDIRPNRLQSFYLRTNIRYTPGLNVSDSYGNKTFFDGLEVNFIQLVLFPGRMF